MSLASLDSLARKLHDKIERKTARVCIVGLGYVGLPLAETFAAGGYTVLGFDIDERKVQSLKQGKSYIGHISSQRVADLIGQGRFDATSDGCRFSAVDAI